MTVETATTINQLNAALPAAGDPKAEGDDHIRLIKFAINATLPNITGVVTPTHTELNFVDGVTSSIQTQIDTKAPIASPTFTGTVTIPSGASISGFAPLASPALTGTPTAPTATAGTATTQVATTAFVTSTALSSSLPGQTGNSGKFITTDGSSASWGSIAGPVSVISTNTTAASGGTYVFTASLTLTLPSSPSVGDWVTVSDRSTSPTSVIDRGGSNLMGLAENMTLNVLDSAFRLVYVDLTRGWVFA